MSNAVLVVSLSQRGAVPASTYELLTAGRRMAEALKQPLCAALFGAQAQDLVELGADKVFAFENPALTQFNDELHAAVLTELCAKEQFSRILLPSSMAGRSLAARLAVTLKAGMAAEVTNIEPGAETAKRSHFSGNLIADVQFKAPVQVMTVQAMVFPRAEKQAGRSGEIVKIAFDPASHPVKTEFVGFQPEDGSEIDLGAAERVVSGGRGLGNAEGFKLIRDLAQTINAAVGASRAVVDSGWIAYKHQVGLTGRAVHPKLYVACGISGQIQHLAGMSSSKNIVAINTDADCPMMQVASVSVQGDLYELIPLVIEEIKKRKSH
jgi:electron transfer flavoprotein alpha subunit